MVIWRYVFGKNAPGFSCLSFALFFFFQAEAQEINLTGRVVDKDSKPVSNVSISLDAARISTTTDWEGNFSLLSSSTGISDLIRKEQAPCYFDGRKLIIKSHGQRVSISIYDLSGRLYTHILKPARLSGEYIVYPAAYLSSEQPVIYMLRVSVDTRIVSYKLVKYADIQYSKGLEPAGSNILTGESHKSEKSLNTIDTLIVHHSAFRTKKIPISEYVTMLGTIQLEDSTFLDYTFNGGDLADLRAVSPDLIFGDLTINGFLSVRSSDADIVFTVDNLRINGKVRFPFPMMAPNTIPGITINASGTVWVDAPISLHGWWGIVSPPEVAYFSCHGTDGVDFTINSSNIFVSNYIHTYGGEGAYIDPGGGILCACNAGNGGNIILNAADTLYIDAWGSNLKLDGGKVGDGINCISGIDGMDGLLDFEGQEIMVEEINLGSSEENMYDYNAQLLEYEKMTLYGHIAYREEHEHRNDDGTWYIYLGFGNVDWIEDIYRLYNPGGSINIDLAADDPLCDLDIFLTSTGGKILDSGKGPTSAEQINYEGAAPGYYWVWVSYKDSGPDRSTNYTLKFRQ